MNEWGELKRLAEAWRDTEHWYPKGQALEEFREKATPAVILALIAETESCRKDAERYRWVRSRPILDGINLNIKTEDFDEPSVDIVARWDTADQLIDEDMSKGDNQ